MNEQKLKFYLIRLRKASIVEMLDRLKGQLFIYSLKVFSSFIASNLKAPEVVLERIQKIKLPIISGNIDEIVLEKVLSGNYFCLNQDRSLIESFENRWRRTFFSDIPMNQEHPDIRAVWESGRLQHHTLLLHYLRKYPGSKNCDQIKAFVKHQLLEWIKINRFLFGPHYMSVMECALRIPVFLRALQTLDNLAQPEQQLILQAIFEHAWITAKRLSQHRMRGPSCCRDCISR